MNYLKCKNILLIITLYTVATIFLNINDNITYINIINPLFWSFIILYLSLYIKKYYIRISCNRKYLIYMVVISCIHAIVYFYLGFIFSFSKSPYEYKIDIILRNIFVYIIPIMGIEMTRGILVIQNKFNKFVIIFSTIIFILININYHVFLDLAYNKEYLFQYICSYIIPLISTEILYTYLTVEGSYLLPLVFKLFYRLLILFLPILPNIDWFVTGTFGILSSFIIYMLFKFKFIKNKIRKKNYKFSNTLSKMSYIVTLLLSITLVCFMVGAFKYEPIVILSNSMKNTFCRGDVVIYKKLTDSELKQIPLYSVIVYKIGEQNVAHRIVSIEKENDTVFYQTKGDRNNVPDKFLVALDQIKGVYVFSVKYIGFPSIWLHDYLTQN